MDNLKLVMYPDERLLKECKKVKLPLSNEDEELLNAMYSWLKEHAKDAVGIAAPQFGVTKRMFCIKYHNKDTKESVSLKMVNPIIVEDRHYNKKGTDVYYVPDGEACLSEPGYRKQVSRKKHIILMGYDHIKKQNVSIPLSDFAAAIAQHELDHLNGICLHATLNDYRR